MKLLIAAGLQIVGLVATVVAVLLLFGGPVGLAAAGVIATVVGVALERDL